MSLEINFGTRALTSLDIERRRRLPANGGRQLISFHKFLASFVTILPLALHASNEYRYIDIDLAGSIN